MNEIFNTVFEVSLRTLSLLSCSKGALSLDKITYLDFIATYSNFFGYGSEDIHGDNRYKYGEIAGRRELINTSLKKLVLEKYAIPVFSSAGIEYRISEKGQEFITKLNDDYFHEFKSILASISDLFNKTEKDIFALINSKEIKGY